MEPGVGRETQGAAPGPKTPRIVQDHVSLLVLGEGVPPGRRCGLGQFSVVSCAAAERTPPMRIPLRPRRWGTGAVALERRPVIGGERNGGPLGTDGLDALPALLLPGGVSVGVGAGGVLGLGVHALRLEPRWGSIREHPRDPEVRKEALGAARPTVSHRGATNQHAL